MYVHIDDALTLMNLIDLNKIRNLTRCLVEKIKYNPVQKVYLLEMTGKITITNGSSAS